MFPFNLPGPQFLVFYALFAVAAIAFFFFVRRHGEEGTPPPGGANDPLLLACLRGGPAEVVRVATLGLIDRGLLTVSDHTITRSATPEAVDRRLEKEILKRSEQGADIDLILVRSAAQRIAKEDYEDQLIRLRLVPDSELANRRIKLMFLALAVLLGVGGIKLFVALQAGRSNVGFLIGMMIVASIVVLNYATPYRTALGDSYLESVRSMFNGLRERASTIRPGSGSRELLWLTALFGATMLPTAAFPFASQLWPRPSSSDGGGGGCGSSSGGSGCGGGGGGCGGCGS
jgi:uncharacterized protein (TIGR04222 family)